MGIRKNLTKELSVNDYVSSVVVVRARNDLIGHDHCMFQQSQVAKKPPHASGQKIIGTT